jgi:hypothetical protein
MAQLKKFKMASQATGAKSPFSNLQICIITMLKDKAYKTTCEQLTIL